MTEAHSARCLPWHHIYPHADRPDLPGKDIQKFVLPPTVPGEQVDRSPLPEGHIQCYEHPHLPQGHRVRQGTFHVGHDGRKRRREFLDFMNRTVAWYPYTKLLTRTK